MQADSKEWTNPAGDSAFAEVKAELALPACQGRPARAGPPLPRSHVRPREWRAAVGGGAEEPIPAD